MRCWLAVYSLHSLSAAVHRGDPGPHWGHLTVTAGHSVGDNVSFREVRTSNTVRITSFYVLSLFSIFLHLKLGKIVLLNNYLVKERD